MKQNHYMTHLLSDINSVFWRMHFRIYRYVARPSILTLYCRMSFIASSPKYYFGNPGWYVKWFGKVDRLCPSGIWTWEPPPPFCDTPPPSSNCFEKQLTRSVLPGFGLAFTLWISAHRNWIIIIFITASQHLRGISPLLSTPEWKYFDPLK